jgi:deazaflavin-dependent oxidoreductase (nitroreductase family)
MPDAEFRAALSDAREVEITVIGRRSGDEISLPVWFVDEDDSLYLVPMTGSDSDWYKNLVESPSIRLAVDGKQITARARPITDATAVADVLEKFRAKYGDSDVERYYSRRDAAVELPLD